VDRTLVAGGSLGHHTGRMAPVELHALLQEGADVLVERAGVIVADVEGLEQATAGALEPLGNAVDTRGLVREMLCNVCMGVAGQDMRRQDGEELIFGECVQPGHFADKFNRWLQVRPFSGLVNRSPMAPRRVGEGEGEKDDGADEEPQRPVIQFHTCSPWFLIHRSHSSRVPV